MCSSTDTDVFATSSGAIRALVDRFVQSSPLASSLSVRVRRSLSAIPFIYLPLSLLHQACHALLCGANATNDGMIKLPFVRRVRRLINTGLIAHPPYGYDDKIFFITSPTENSADGSTRSSTAGGLSGRKTLCSKWRHAGGAGGFG